MANERFVALRRADIPAGTLQLLDLDPNESQKQLTYSPPGQTKYLRRPDNDSVGTFAGAGGALLTQAEYRGVAAYLLDHVEAGGVGGGGGPAFTASEANTAAASLIAILDAGTALDLTAVNAALAAVVASTELVATTSASTGDLVELLKIMDGAEYVLPAASTVDDDGSTFTTAVSGSFTTGAHRQLYEAGLFNLSLAEGHISKLKDSSFEYLGTAGSAVAVYDETGAVL